MDIVTHLAVSASQDWTKVDRIMVGNCDHESGAVEVVYQDYWQGVERRIPTYGGNVAFIFLVELCEHYRPKLDDGPAGGEDAGLCSSVLCFVIAIYVFYRACRAGWMVPVVRPTSIFECRS